MNGDKQSTALPLVNTSGYSQEKINGTWRAASASTDFGRQFRDPMFDDSSWHEIKIPSSWSDYSEITDNPPVLYRCHFGSSLSTLNNVNDRIWLRFDNVFTHAGVWVDGTYCGEIDNYFSRHCFEITGQSARQDHVLAMELASGTKPWSSSIGDIGGIYETPQIIRTGRLRITRLKVLCAEATEQRAILELHLEVNTSDASIAEVQTIIRANTGDNDARDPITVAEISRPLARGANRLKWKITIPNPPLWWPWELGEQNLIDLEIQVKDRACPDVVSDHTEITTGIREVALIHGMVAVNGEALYVRGLGGEDNPATDPKMPLDSIERQLSTARDVGVNVINNDYWLEQPAFYDIADRLGLMLFQGMPSMFGPEYSYRTPKLARQSIEVLSHHPSVVAWIRPQLAIQERIKRSSTLKTTIERSDSSRPSLELTKDQRIFNRSSKFSKRFLKKIAPTVDILPVNDRFVHEQIIQLTNEDSRVKDDIRTARLNMGKTNTGFVATKLNVAKLANLNHVFGPVNFAVETFPAHNGTIALGLYLINDLHVDIVDGVIRSRVSCGSKSWTWTWGGEIPAKHSGFIGPMTIQPPGRSVRATIDVELESPTKMLRQSLSILL